MKLAIVPDPSAVVIAAMRELAPDARVFAPWAIPAALAIGPASWRRFVRRRGCADPHVSLPGWSVLELALKAWQRDRTDRQYRSLFAMRRLVSEIAARWVSRDERITTVLAPSLAAREVFARARGEAILVEDLPGLRQLHSDLARASVAHPDCRFLDRFRASSAQVARQESEWVLADEIAVRGRHARERHRQRTHRLLGATSSAAGRPVTPMTPLARASAAGAPVVVLAGLATARHGSCEVLALLEAMPAISLRVRAGEGAEPRALLEHPRVVASRSPRLEDAAAVLAPSWVETHPVELLRAAELGVPIIATARGSGHVEPSSVIEVDVGDVAAIAAALEVVLGRDIDAVVEHAAGGAAAGAQGASAS